MLINFAKQSREHDPLLAARVTGDLRFSITEPDGKLLPAVGRLRERAPFTAQIRLRTMEASTAKVQLKEYAFSTLKNTGRYRLNATMKIAGQTIPAPPLEFEVFEPTADAILATHQAPVEGREATLPILEQCKPLVQQVQVGTRALLIYRRSYDPKSGGGVYLTVRLAELPGKVEMKVEGAYGAGKPLTVTYKDATSPTGTVKIVINSIDGMPWTEEEERLLQEKSNPKKEETPAPRPKP